MELILSTLITFAPVVTAIASILLVCVAICGLKTWNKQFYAKHALDILECAIDFANKYNHLRNPQSTNVEEETARNKIYPGKYDGNDDSLKAKILMLRRNNLSDVRDRMYRAARITKTLSWNKEAMHIHEMGLILSEFENTLYAMYERLRRQDTFELSEQETNVFFCDLNGVDEQKKQIEKHINELAKRLKRHVVP